MSTRLILPNGLWPSPVTAALVSQRLRFDDAQWALDGQTLVWSEGRSTGSTLLAQTGCEARRELTTDHAPRGGIGYGGGAFTTGSQPDGSNFTIFCERDGRLYRQGLDFSSPTPVTPAFGAVASPAISPDARWLVFVFSDGKTDLLGIVDTEGSHWPAQLISGADFYMQPAWHPSGKYLAWVEWNRPNMPWDGTRIQLAQVVSDPTDGFPHLEDIRTVAGGNIMAASQPVFSPDGRWLCFIEEGGASTDDEWPDLVLYNLESGQRQYTMQCEDFELSQPAWVQGLRSIGWSPDSRLIYHFRYQGPLASLWQLDIQNGVSTHLDTAPYTWLTQLSVAAAPNTLSFIASAPNHPERVVAWHNGSLRVAARSAVENLPPEVFSMPREIRWLAPDGSPVYGLYYPPYSLNFNGEDLPPAIINIHGGPTTIAATRFNPEAAYFTSRGYAWVEVNYRGSTGYGRTYRNALRERWGQVDMEDAAGCAHALAEQGLADPGKMVIRGSSAGGYTVLNTLIHYPGLFRAGICLYGISNLFTQDQDSLKFEAHYNTALVGSLPAAAERYRAFSPIFHADQIKDPIYIFQGEQDLVVQPGQSEEIIAVLKQNKAVFKYRLYEGEGHGFRKSETIADYLKETERFLQQYVLLT